MVSSTSVAAQDTAEAKQVKEDLFRALWNQGTAHFNARAYAAAQELYKVRSSTLLRLIARTFVDDGTCASHRAAQPCEICSGKADVPARKAVLRMTYWARKGSNPS